MEIIICKDISRGGVSYSIFVDNEIVEHSLMKDDPVLEAYRDMPEAKIQVCDWR